MNSWWKASKVWFLYSHNCTLANGAVFHSLCQVWLSSGPPEIFTLIVHVKLAHSQNEMSHTHYKKPCILPQTLHAVKPVGVWSKHAGLISGQRIIQKCIQSRPYTPCTAGKLLLERNEEKVLVLILLVGHLHETSFDYNYQNAFRCNLCYVDLCQTWAILHKRKQWIQ